MEGQNEEYSSIEKLKAKKNTSDAVFEGIKAANGWKTGKMVTESTFDNAVKAFEIAPMDGRKVKKNV